MSAKECFQLAEKDAKAKERISIYHDLLSKCYEALGQIDNALKEANLAIDECVDQQYKKELIERVSFLGNHQ